MCMHGNEWCQFGPVRLKMKIKKNNFLVVNNPPLIRFLLSRKYIWLYVYVCMYIENLSIFLFSYTALRKLRVTKNSCITKIL